MFSLHSVNETSNIIGVNNEIRHHYQTNSKKWNISKWNTNNTLLIAQRTNVSKSLNKWKISKKSECSTASAKSLYSAKIENKNNGSENEGQF